MKIEDREAVFEQLKVDEGVVYAIYNDHLGYPTFGVGHLILDSDEEFGKPVGTEVSEERVGRVSTEILTLPSENVTLYTEKGTLETFPAKSSKSWLT